MVQHLRRCWILVVLALLAAAAGVATPRSHPAHALDPESELEDALKWSLAADETELATLAADSGSLELLSATGPASTGTDSTSSTLARPSSDFLGPGEWPMGNHDLARSGNAGWEEFISVPLQTRWTGSALDKVQTNPAIVDDVAYFGGAGSDRRVYAMDLHTGTAKWIVQIPGSVLSSPAIAGSSVYFGGADGRLYRVNRADGALMWSYPESFDPAVGPIVGGPAVRDGVVYFGARDAKVYAVDAETGALLWSASTPEGITSSVTVAEGQVLVTSGANEWVSAFDATTGALRWQRGLYSWSNANTLGTAVSVSASRAYLTGMDGNLHVLNTANGTTAVGPIALGSTAQNTPVLIPGYVFVGTNNGRVLKFDLAGNQLWSNTLPFNALVSSPVFASGKVFASSTDGTLYVIDAETGAGLTTFTTGGALFAPPSIVSNRVILGSDDAKVYALGPGLPSNTTFAAQPVAHRYGVRGDEAYAADPVSTSTGNFVYSANDIAVGAGAGMPARFARSYNALDATTDGPLGYGWTHTYNIALTIGTDTVTARASDGRQDIYTKNTDGAYTGPPDITDRLSEDASGFDLVTKADVKLRFDLTGRLTSMTDRSENAIVLNYDGAGRLATVTDAANRSLTFTYGTNAQIATITDVLNRTWLYRYDANDNLTEVEGPGSDTWTYVYDANHRITQILDPDGVATVTNTYDADNRVSEQRDAENNLWAYSYNAASTVVTDPLGRSTTYEFDANHRTTRVVDPRGATRRFIWDGRSRLIAEVDPVGLVTRHAYDNRGNRTALLDPAGHKLAFTYDSADNLISVTNAKGQTTTYTYDTAGRMMSVTSAAGVATSVTYRSDGLPATATNGVGGTTQFLYDSTGLPTGAKDPLNRQTQLDVDKAGRLTAATNPAGATTSYTYDSGGRISKVADAAGSERRFTYDGRGLVRTVTDANNHTTTYGYDRRGLLTSTTDALGRTTTYSYDAAQRLISRTDARGITISYGYNGSDELITVDYPDQPDVSFTRDLAGRPTAMSDATGTTSYTYNPSGQLAAERRTVGTASGWGATELEYTYDLLGRRNSLTASHPTGNNIRETWHYVYDADGRTAEVFDNLGNATKLDYDGAGRLASITHPENVSGVFSAYSYDAAGQLLEVAHRNRALLVATTDDALSTWSYGYDAAGNRTTATRDLKVDSTILASSQATYGYDVLGRLTSARSTDPAAPASANADFAYDAVGNRTSLAIVGAAPVTYSYDAADQMTSDGIATYNYDAAGNQLTKNVGGQATRTVSYDSAGRVSTMSDGATSVSFGYDGLGRRVNRTDAAGLTEFVYDGRDVVEELGPVFGARETSISGMLLNRVSAGGQTFFHADGTGNIGEVTGSIAYAEARARYSYAPFGEHTTTSSGSNADTENNRNTYSGSWGVRDESLGLMDMRARMYDPATGQFLSRDPLVDITGEPYAYASGDPISLIDPYGLCSLGPARIGFLSNDDGSCRGSGVLEKGYHGARFVRNGPVTGVAYVWSELNGAECTMQTGLMGVCLDDGTTANLWAPVMTAGNTVIADAGFDVSGDLLAHETKHADQWFIFGYPAFPILYGGATVQSLITHGDPACGNVFEQWAHLGDGGYDHCVTAAGK